MKYEFNALTIAIQLLIDLKKTFGDDTELLPIIQEQPKKKKMTEDQIKSLRFVVAAYKIKIPEKADPFYVYFRNKHIVVSKREWEWSQISSFDLRKKSQFATGIKHHISDLDEVPGLL